MPERIPDLSLERNSLDPGKFNGYEIVGSLRENRKRLLTIRRGRAMALVRLENLAQRKAGVRVVDKMVGRKCQSVLHLLWRSVFIDCPSYWFSLQNDSSSPIISLN